MLHLVALLALTVTAIVACSLLWFYFATGVVPMSSGAGEAANVVALLKEAGLPKQAVLYELGCGWGTLVGALARAFPEAQIRGIEISPFPYWIARWRTRNAPNVQLRRANFFDCDISDADAIACYLMIRPMPALAALLDRSVRPGTPVVSLCFWFRDRQVAARRKQPGLSGEVALYLWPARRLDAAAGHL